MHDPETGSGQPIGVRCADSVIAVHPNIAPAEIIGEEYDDIWPFPVLGRLRQEQGASNSRENEEGQKTGRPKPTRE
jgi:hypothetical protein